jgi:hypothetical protein
MEKTTQGKIWANKWTACSTWVVSSCVIFIKGKYQCSKKERTLRGWSLGQNTYKLAQLHAPCKRKYRLNWELE